MKKEMTIRGIGIKLERIGVPYLICTLITSYLLRPLFSFGITDFSRIAVGLTLLIPGAILHIIAAVTMLRGFKKGELLTRGLFRMSRNPMYATMIFLIIPGLSLLCNSWLLLPSIPLMLLIFFSNIHEEEQYLEKTFGEAFKSYKQKTGILLPKLF